MIYIYIFFPIAKTFSDNKTVAMSEIVISQTFFFGPSVKNQSISPIIYLQRVR